jgi:DNA-binding MarR family transcriptional regulator
MARRSDLRLLVLHGVHLKGVAEVGPIAETIGLREGEVAAAISRLEAERYVQRREGQLAGWGLTPAGRNEHQRLLAEEIDSDGLRPQLERVYRRFLVLNPQVLEVCSQWQVRRLAGHLVRNDHSDADYDHAVIDELLSLHRRAGPLCDRLARVLDRFRPYKPRLDRAVKRIRAGDTDYVAKPIVPSYHTVWFELHEDLLASLGIDRTVEAAG